jgi:hypothetical protein
VRHKLVDCGYDRASARIGSTGLAAVYNIDYSVLYNGPSGTKWAPALCRWYAHELYIARSGIDWVSLQAGIGTPILKASCSYTHRRCNF